MSENTTDISGHPCLGDRTQNPSIPPDPTRVILRLSVKDFDNKRFSWSDYPSAIEAYLKWSNRSIEDWRRKKHNIFVEQLQHPELKQKRFHVILDLNSGSHMVENMNCVHHEIYEIKRDDNNGQLRVLQARSPQTAQDIVRRTRRFTDQYYPWGSEGYE